MNYGIGGDLAPNIKASQRASGCHSLPPTFQVLAYSPLLFDSISLCSQLFGKVHHDSSAQNRDLLRVEASCQCFRTLVTGHQLYKASYARLCHQQVFLLISILYHVSHQYLGDQSLLDRRC